MEPAAHYDIHTNNEELLIRAHQGRGDYSLVKGRNVSAGYTRGEGLVFGELPAFLKSDPIYQESYSLGKETSYLSVDCLANLFLIMKYGMRNLCSSSTTGMVEAVASHLSFEKTKSFPSGSCDAFPLCKHLAPLSIIQCGSFRGGSALFLAYAARRLELPVIVYALDTFSGIPDEHEMLDFYKKGTLADANFEQFMEQKEKTKLNNLFLIKGRFQDTLPWLLPIIKNIALAHIDCLAYSSVKYALTAVHPFMDPAGGYIVIDHATRDSSSLGAFQAVEEMAQEHRLNAEQTVPHFVYRVFK